MVLTTRSLYRTPGRPMAIETTTEPAIEPVTWAEMQDHSRIDEPTEQEYVEGLIVAARKVFERDTGQRLINQEVRIQFDGFVAANELMTLPVYPVVNIDTIEYIDADGATQQLDDYQLDTSSTYHRLAPAVNEQWPQTQHGALNTVSMALTAGYGVAADDVPADIRHAIKFLVAHWFEQREPLVLGTIATPIPETLQRLMALHRKRFDFGTGGM